MKKEVIGITGGIATGKSNVTNVLRSKGYLVIDADEISRGSLEFNLPCYNRVCEVFGEAYLNSDYTINRTKLGGLIFSDKKAKKDLENIIHPYVYQKMVEKINESYEKLIFLDIPLLFETDFKEICDKIVCVYVPPSLQLERLMLRDSISKSLAIKKIKSQLDLEEKKKRSDYVIDSSGTFEETKIKIENMLGVLLNG